MRPTTGTARYLLDVRDDEYGPVGVIEAAHGLDDAQLSAIASLERRVVEHDGGRLKLEWHVLRGRSSQSVNDVLAWDGDALVGYCGLYSFGAPLELAGAVSPDHRRRGLGSALLSRALALASERGIDSALLVTPRATGAGRQFAVARGATFSHSEHHLVLDPSQLSQHHPAMDRAKMEPGHTSPVPVIVRPSRHEDRATIRAVLIAAFGDEASAGEENPPLVNANVAEMGDRELVIERDGQVVGTLRLEVDGDHVGIYGFAVRPDLQGQGIGRTVLQEVCAKAAEDGARLVTLEVAVENDRALGLYTSIGFEQRTTEDYFEIDVHRARAPSTAVPLQS